MTLRHGLETFENKTALQAAAAKWIAERLRDAITRRGSAVFMGSGGSTPGPVYESLSHASLAWDQVHVGLCDERWVEDTHPASNGAMIERTLLQNKAALASYTPMKVAGADPFDAVDVVNELYLEAGLTDVMLLGMGPDAHTLSWFAGARGYDAATDPDTTAMVAAIEAKPSEVTGPNLLRMTLTQPCIAYARHVLLLITGKDKRDVFERAGPDAPVSLMRRAAGDALTVFYCD